MTEAQPQTAPPRGAELQALARELSRGGGARLADETERERRLPDELVARLRDSGLLRAGAPREVDGLELAPGRRRCAAPRRSPAATRRPAGACRSRSRAACSPPTCPAESRDELFGDGRGVAAGVWAPRGKARPVDGGVVVSRPLAVLQRDHARRPAVRRLLRRRRRGAGERPVPRVVALPTEDLEILDTWHTLGPARHRQPRRRRRRGLRPRRRACSRCSTGRSSTARCTASRSSASSRSRSRRPRWATRAARSTTSSALAARQGRPGLDAHAGRAPAPPRRRSPRAEASLRAARALYYEAIEAAWEAAQDEAPVPRRAAHRPAPGRHARGADVGRGRRASMYDLGRRHRDLRRLAAAAALPRRAHRHRALPGQRGVPRAPRPRPARARPPTPRCCEPAGRGRPAVLARPARRGGARHRARGPQRRAGHALDRRDGDLRRVRAGHRRRPARARACG